MWRIGHISSAFVWSLFAWHHGYLYVVALLLFASFRSLIWSMDGVEGLGVSDCCFVRSTHEIEWWHVGTMGSFEWNYWLTLAYKDVCVHAVVYMWRWTWVWWGVSVSMNLYMSVDVGCSRYDWFSWGLVLCVCAEIKYSSVHFFAELVLRFYQPYSQGCEM